MIAADRADVMLINRGRIALELLLIENKWLEDNRKNFVVIDPPYKLDPIYLGIPKSMNKSHLLELINKALEEIKADGTYQQIVDANIEMALIDLKIN